MKLLVRATAHNCVLWVAVLALASFVLAPAAPATSGTLVITSNTTLREDQS